MRVPAQTLHIKPLAMALSALLLTGCTTFSNDGGLKSVSALTQERVGQPITPDKSPKDTVSIQTTINRLLAQPLSADIAVHIALLNNKGLRASLADLGVAEADLVQAGRLRNPDFSFTRMRSGDDIEIDRSIMFDMVGLLTLPMRSKIESGRFEQAKLQAASQAGQLATDTRKAYFNAVAAQ